MQRPTQLLTLALGLACIAPTFAMKRERKNAKSHESKAKVSQEELNSQVLTKIKALNKGRKLAPIAKLLKKGADANMRTPDNNPLLGIAIDKNNTKLAELLIAHNANVNAEVGQFGMTFLMFAAQNGLLPMCELLIANNANVQAKDGMGLTAWDRAGQRNHAAICALLEQHGAQPVNKTQKKLGNTWVMTDEFKQKFFGNSDDPDDQDALEAEILRNTYKNPAKRIKP